MVVAPPVYSFRLIVTGSWMSTVSTPDSMPQQLRLSLLTFGNVLLVSHILDGPGVETIRPAEGGGGAVLSRGDGHIHLSLGGKHEKWSASSITLIFDGG